LEEWWLLEIEETSQYFRDQTPIVINLGTWVISICEITLWNVDWLYLFWFVCCQYIENTFHIEVAFDWTWQITLAKWFRTSFKNIGLTTMLKNIWMNKKCSLTFEPKVICSMSIKVANCLGGLLFTKTSSQRNLLKCSNILMP